ncbi:MAG TPA: sorbosone dehydrogenase family protein [Terriglobales bacterium]|nr:sorbosone dehydrogenase family protein [Terriglobales bacterium]
MRLTLASCVVLLTACSPSAPQPAAAERGALTVPPGFHVEVFAETGSTPRLLAFSPGGVLLTTAMADGKVLALPDTKRNGRAERVVPVLSELNAPHGIAFHEGKLYIAETNRVVRYDWDEANLRASNPKPLADLPGGGGHFTRTLVFHQGKMYVSIGSTCNVCREQDERRAAVMEFNPDGSGGRVFARGLRNAVGLAVSPQTNTVWVSDNGRDWLGDNLPPEEINDLGASGGDFGWPFCYGDRTPDTEFSREATTRCPSTIPAKFQMQAHSAPLGIAFYTGTQFPPEYRGDLFVAFHGSWNRSVPTGYKVVRIEVNERGEATGISDFLTGFIAPGETRKGRWRGRPVGLAVGPEGALYVSDDSREGRGKIYRVTWEGK